MYYKITVISCIWIFTQVDAQFDDGLNPIKVDLSVWHQRNPRVAARTNHQLNCEKPSLYICEEPPDFTPAYSNKICNYRNNRYQEQVYKWVAGRGCLYYTPDFLYIGGRNSINLNAGCVYGDLFAPCLEMVKDDGTCGCYPFDPAFEEVATTVRNATVPSAHGRWEKCYYEASDCCNHFMGTSSNLTIFPVTDVCETTFDGWTCWHATSSGTLASSVCSDLAYFSTGPTCHHYSTKVCYPNGTWEQNTEYSTCSVTPRLMRRYWFYTGVLAASTAACVPAILIFIFYKRLRVTNVALHRNLLIAIIMRNVLVIMSRTMIYMDELTSVGETTMSANSRWCRTITALEKATAGTVFLCILVEGVYLHRLIVTVFRQQFNIAWLYGMASVLIIAPVGAWVAVMMLYNDHSCWVVYTIPHIQWILDAPRIFILIINTILFVDIFRVLITKIRNSETANQLNTVKATLFLMPLFGVQFIFTAVRPNTTSCTYEQVYYHAAYTVEGFQGFIVALLYCYVNKEVHELIRATYKKTEMGTKTRVRNSPSTRGNIDSDDRRYTYSTNIPANQEEELKGQNIKPKYVAEIISIQASERLAEILDPVYETINFAMSNEGYDRLERIDLDSDSGFIPNRNSKVEEYYGFTNVSSVSISCRDWLKDTPSYNCSVNNAIEYYRPSISMNDQIETNKNKVEDNDDYVDMDAKNFNDDENERINKDLDEHYQTTCTNCENMLDEIMQCIQTNTDDKEQIDANNLTIDEVDK